MPDDVFMRLLHHFPLALAFALVLSACSSSSEEGTAIDGANTTQADTPETNVTTSGDAEAVVYTTDEHLTWVVEDLLSPDETELSEITLRFSEQFLDELPVETILGTSEPLAGDWKIVEDDKGNIERNAVIEQGNRRLNLSLTINPADGGRMVGIFIQPASPDPQEVTANSTDVMFESVGTSTGYGLYDTSSGSCTSIHELRGDVVQPTGSEFKLWVLAAVAEQIQGGELTWEEKITLTPELRGIPGTPGVASQPDGTELSVAELATAMIGISDNYATDLLMDRVGREAVEQAMVNSGVVDPDLNIPMLNTREIFLLKLVPEHADYLTLGVDEKRAYIDDVLADDQSLTTGDESDAPKPPWNIEQLEWFASPADICRTYLYLAELNDAPGMEPLNKALTLDPQQGLSFIDQNTWTTAWYKGGSEPGLLAMSWFLEDSSGKTYVVAGSMSDPDVVISEIYAVAALEHAVVLLENEISSR